MKLFRLEWVVFVVAFAILSWNLWSVGIASGWIDPILHFGAQDEATYTREAIAMARDGGWMTPEFLGRWVFEKPPLLMWLSALAMKLCGIGPMSARIPVILAGALICTLCFVMVRRERSTAAGLATAAMALSSQILFIMSRHNMTDILLACTGMCAFAIVLRDPELRSTGNLAGFVIAAAAGMMAKSVAGILVLAVMGVVVGLGRGQWGRAIVASALAMVCASPWFLYSLLLHRDWFLADMGFQLITIGNASHQTSQENHVWFYVVRILNSDLVPLVLAAAAVPALWQAIRQRKPSALLAASYGVIYFAALMVFRFHSEQYLCWFVPSLILIAGLYSPLLNGRGAAVAIAVICVVFLVKMTNPDRDFGVSVRGGSTIAAAPVLSRYCEEHRATDLYILGVDDEFYSAVLPLQHVRYGWIDTTDMVSREHPHLPYLGILIVAEDLSKLEEKLPEYRERLRAWGIDSTRAIASGISAHDIAGLLRIIQMHPESDFLVARSIVANPEETKTHRVSMSNAEFTLLESKGQVASEAPTWTCRM